MVDLVCLKGTKVNNIKPRTGHLVFSDGSGRFASDLSSYDQLPSLDLSFETVERRLFNCIVRKCLIVDNFGDRKCRARKNQWQALTAHQFKKEVGYEFQEYIFTLATEEKCKILEKNRVEKPDMTVCVKTIRGKTTSVKCERRQNTTRIMEIVERKTSIPRGQLFVATQGKVLKDKKTIEESSIEAGATIEMSLRTMGGVEKEELMETSETDKHSRLSEDAVYLRKEINQRD